MIMNGMYDVRAMKMRTTHTPASHLPRTICQSRTGAVNSRTMVPSCCSSASSRIVRRTPAVKVTPWLFRKNVLSTWLDSCLLEPSAMPWKIRPSTSSRTAMIAYPVMPLKYDAKSRFAMSRIAFTLPLPSYR